ncbi:helix-turn-helix transcriptional regulator [Delftia acidovorans]|uniref:S24 family peptidase n=1 Tax=Delftia acidovorans TaxID=80866 RepID=UPI0018D77228|nr:helix-turn-helix transcriptional regulator [Delftia acidovorans]QPR33392.1 helix-turn-helix transcriptional regulator [Delftia acidovorans]
MSEESRKTQSLPRLLEAAAERGVHGAAAIAKALNASDQAVNNWKTRGVPHAMSVEAQRLWGVSAQWLATGEGDKWLPATTTVKKEIPAPAPVPSPDGGPPDLIIQQYEDTGGGMSHGFNLEDNPPGHIRSWRVTHDWLRINVPIHTGIKNLCIVTGFGSSMKPMFNPGDPILVDLGIKVVDQEGAYFFRVGNEGYIKLLQRIPEFDGPGFRLRAISKNPDYQPFDISPKNPHFEVIGKILTVWRSEHF